LKNKANIWSWSYHLRKKKGDHYPHWLNRYKFPQALTCSSKENMAGVWSNYSRHQPYSVVMPASYSYCLASAQDLEFCPNISHILYYIISQHTFLLYLTPCPCIPGLVSNLHANYISKFFYTVMTSIIILLKVEIYTK
jgi:hypothetical protein